jgi:hypothetical protein
MAQFSNSLAKSYAQVALVFSGVAIGALAFSQNFTLKKGDFVYTTDNDEHALAVLHQTYEHRIKQLKEDSAAAREEYQIADSENKAEIVTHIAVQYVTPRSQERLFGEDITIYSDAKANTTIIMPRHEFASDVVRNWEKVLTDAGVKVCVDTLRITMQDAPYSKQDLQDGVRQCMARQKLIPRQPLPKMDSPLL